MSKYWVAIVNVLMLGLYAFAPSRFSWYVLIFPLIITLTYFLIGAGTKLARNMMLVGIASLSVYLIYSAIQLGGRYTALLIMVYAAFRLLKLDGKLAAQPKLGKYYFTVEMFVYGLVALAGYLIGLENMQQVLLAGTLVLAAREITEKDLISYLVQRQK